MSEIFQISSGILNSSLFQGGEAEPRSGGTSESGTELDRGRTGQGRGGRCEVGEFSKCVAVEIPFSIFLEILSINATVKCHVVKSTGWH